jgi:hypothetical protein
MKTENPKIYVNDGTNKDHAVGTLLYIQDCPIEPDVKDFPFSITRLGFVDRPAYDSAKEAYQSSLELAIKGGVEFKDQEEIRKLVLIENKSTPQLNSFLSIPSGYSVEVEPLCLCGQDSCENSHKKVAILKPSDNSAHSKEEVNEAIKFATWYSGMEQSKVKKAYERFKRENL